MKPFALLRSTLCINASLLSLCVAATPLPVDLTPVGAERGPSSDGRIPAWNGGLHAGQVSLTVNGTPLDPYADERPLYVISASNYTQYREQLTAGQVALMQRYPKSFRLPVYPSHRSVAVPPRVSEWAWHNAASARLVNHGNGVAGFAGVVAFPGRAMACRCCGTTSRGRATAATAWPRTALPRVVMAASQRSACNRTSPAPTGWKAARRATCCIT